MMQFYKKRDFGEFISDSLLFFKLYGKNYFRNFLIINGGLLLALLVLVVVGYGEIWTQFFSEVLDGGNFYFSDYFRENELMLGLVTLMVGVILLLLSLLMYAFPVLYLKRLSETNNANITTNEMIDDIKSKTGRLLIFLLGLIFIILPLVAIIFSVSAMLTIVLIGFGLLIFLGPATINVVNFLLFDYLNTDKGFFESFSYASRAQFSYKQGSSASPFWKYWGSTAIIYLIIQIVMGAFTFIPMFFYGLSASTFNSPTVDDGKTMVIMLFVIYGISILFSFIVTNVIMVNAGLQYYDSRTDLHRAVDLSEIDTIGENV